MKTRLGNNFTYDDGEHAPMSPSGYAPNSRTKAVTRLLVRGGRDAEGVEFEAPRSETPKASRGWSMGRGYPPPQPTRGSGGAS